MLEPEQMLRFELVKLAVGNGTPLEKVLDLITPLLKWIQESHHLLPCSTDGKV